MPLDHWQAWEINHFARKSIPVLDHPSAKETFPSASLILPWKLSDILLLPSVPRSRAQPSPYFPSFAGTCIEQWGHLLFSSSPVWTAQYSQSLLRGHFLQLSYPPLDAFKNVNILFILWRPELHTIFWRGCNNDKHSGRITSFDQQAMLSLMKKLMKHLANIKAEKQHFSRSLLIPHVCCPFLPPTGFMQTITGENHDQKFPSIHLPFILLFSLRPDGNLSILCPVLLIIKLLWTLVLSY